MSFYNSIVAVKIDSKKSIRSNVIKNTNIERINVADYRATDYFPKVDRFINKKVPALKKIPVIKKIIRYFFYTHNFIIKFQYYLKLKKFFKK